MDNESWAKKVNAKLCEENQWIKCIFYFLLGYIWTFAMLLVISINSLKELNDRVGVSTVALSLLLLSIAIYPMIVRDNSQEKSNLLLVLICRWNELTDEEKAFIDWDLLIGEKNKGIWFKIWAKYSIVIMFLLGIALAYLCEIKYF